MKAGICSETTQKGSTMKKLSAFALVTMMALVGTAAADPKKGAAADNKVKVYDFSGDTIEGDLVKPEGTDLNVRDFAKHSSLIKIRKDFVQEIIKSAEDL